uniref:Major basic nuclear protein 1 n=1 Tax=Crypthecodinium cohnii TaxID=2866 RepID=HCC1_CRYCO|nr:RecName: Full=Major basic nuclear protein 1; AltName: Full=Protein p14 alpha/beta chain [Crypthecodinium cohnii]CAA41349.1 p14 (alpha and beta) [Crypthecodinium cohnii]
MAPKMKAAMKAMKAPAMKGKAMTKTGLAEAWRRRPSFLRRTAGQSWRAWPRSCAAEVKKTGKLTIPGLVMVKTRKKPATKAGKREMFGKVVLVKASCQDVVKAYPVKALKTDF